MLEAIADTTARTAGSTGVEAIAPEVMDAIERVPRHEFVPPEIADLAYENRPLPIGHGQTISQPYIVALMTHLLGLGSHHRVLEIGTGSGYQAAVLAELVERVHTIEIVPPLARQAEERLPRLGYRNVEVRLGDGYYGWRAAGPFDAIIVTAAASHVPPPLVEQLAPNGVLVIPVGRAVLGPDAAPRAQAPGRRGDRPPGPPGPVRAPHRRALEPPRGVVIRAAEPGSPRGPPGTAPGDPRKWGRSEISRRRCPGETSRSRCEIVTLTPFSRARP